MVVKEYYEGKRVLVTGGTGFIGKVLIEKLLRDIPNIGAVYVLVRTNNDFTLKDRYEDDLVSSRVFDRLRAEREDFLPFIHAKLIPIAGDLSLNNCGLSPDDMNLLVRNVEVVINLAASIDFRERIDKAIDNNVIGALRIFNLSKKFHHLEAFVHCSTAYVNANRTGLIKEQLAPFNFDVEDMVELIQKTDTSKLEKLTDTLLAKYKYPNTYCFTKAIAEHLILRKREGVPVVFLRPSIVGASLKEPTPGWIDSVAAAAAPILYLGVGLVKFMRGKSYVTADIVPVDQVVNALICSAPAVYGRDTLEIAHCGTSHTNPEIWHNFGFWAAEYWKQHVPKKGISQTPSFIWHSNRLIYNTHFFFSYTAPSVLYSMYTYLFGNARQRKDAEKFRKMTNAAEMINQTFLHFTNNEWIFDTTNLEQLLLRLDKQDRDMFSCDFREIVWQQYLHYFCHGLHKYVLKEEGVTAPTSLIGTNIIITHDLQSKKNYIHWIFADISWAYSRYSNVTKQPVIPATPPQIKSLVLSSPRIKQLISQLATEQKVSVASLDKRARFIVDRISGNLNLTALRFFGWFLKKVWRRIYRGIHVDEKGIAMVREAIKSTPVVLIPTHRSYVDFLIISYIFFEYDLPVPRIAAGEDFLSIIIVRSLLRNCGAFFMRRSFDGDRLYWAIFAEYVERLVVEHLPVEFFLEGKRSRSGKSLYPKNGILNMVCAPYLDKKIPDLQIIPISISYEKVLEGELYTQEMMGESKTRESLNGLLRASKVLRMNFGRINVLFGCPISVRNYTQDYTLEVQKRPPPSLLPSSSPPPPPKSFDPFTQSDDRRDLIHHLGYTLIHILSKNIAITTTAIVSTVLLTHRRGISREELIIRSDWLREEIIARKAAIAFEGPTEVMVDYALKLLSNLITNRRNMYEPAQADAQNPKGFGNPNFNYRKNILVLAFYRNQLIHLFQWDAIVACVIAGLCGIKSAKKHKKVNEEAGVEESVLYEEILFLAKLSAADFVITPDQDIKESIAESISRMVSRGFISCHEQQVPSTSTTTSTTTPTTTKRFYNIEPRGEGRLTFLCHLFWPFVESYLVALLTLFTVTADGIKMSSLQQRMSWLAEKMYDEGKLTFFESCNMDVLANAITVFTDMGILIKKKMEVFEDGRKRAARKKTNDRDRVPERKEEELLVLAPPYDNKNGQLSDLAKHIGKYRKTPPIAKLKTNELTRAIVEDFPLVAKL